MKTGLNLLLCVDWEGLSLEQENLEALQSFKKRWAIPLLHFMNPAYFTSKKLKERAQTMDWTPFLDETAMGLHLHASRHFVESCGLSFRDGPCFSRQGDQNPQEFQGHEVMLHTYSVFEFKTMLAVSADIFSQWNWPQAHFFRAGGWMMNPDFIPALKDQGFCADSSSTSPENLNHTCWQGEPLQRYLQILWGQQSDRSQPYQDQGFWHIPNNGGAIDYWQSEDRVLNWAGELLKQDGSTAVITIHQETAAQHLWKLDGLLNNLLQDVSVLQPVDFKKFQRPSQPTSHPLSV